MVEIWNRTMFNDTVIREGKLAAVEFYSDGAPIFQGFGSNLETLSDSFSERVAFGKINVRDEEALAEKYAVRSVPTLMIFCRGKGICEVVGDAEPEKLRAVLNSAVEIASP